MSRRISSDGIYHIALIRRLNRDLGVSVGNAVLLAVRLLSAEAGRIPLAGGLELRLDIDLFRREIDAAVADAVESLAPARRGRPPLDRGAGG